MDYLSEHVEEIDDFEMMENRRLTTFFKMLKIVSMFYLKLRHNLESEGKDPVTTAPT